LLLSVFHRLRSGPLLSPPERIIGLHRVASINPSARLTVLDTDKAPGSRIELGSGVFLGDRVELTACGGGSVTIDDDTSIQDGSIIAGHVRIGAHCLFGKYVFVASRGHNFRHRPEWLIRDQDAEVLSSPVSGDVLARSQVRIEDDCWIAQSVIVSPGVYIGRGAVIGANAVVTKDVGPYEVHGGVPNRKIGTRLDFVPPTTLDARDDACIPYFYRGFDVSRQSLAESRRHGIVVARHEASLVLGSASSGKVSLSGTRIDKTGDLRLAIAINGTACGEHVVARGPFTLEFDVPPRTATTMPAPLASFTTIDIAASGTPQYGINSATLTVSA
jgi:acetyltransferase-like isoleucine patch superfamily enzyme